MKPQFAILATDVVIFKLEDDLLQVLLVQAKAKHFSGKWALPGGLVDPSESLESATLRFQKMFLSLPESQIYLDQLYTFGDPKRDPLGRVVSVAYLSLTQPSQTEPKTTPDYPSAAWYPVSALPPLAYDHDHILKAGLDRLRGKLKYTNLIYALMAEFFTLTALQRSYEVILGIKLDKRNFRKKILSLKLVKPTSRIEEGATHRPAKLFTFTRKSPEIINLLFEA